MTTYIVIEYQTDTTGNVATLITQHATRAEAESKYYTVLGYAAVSTLPVHAAAITTNEGFPIMQACYKHDVQPTPEPVEPEPEGEA